MRKSLGKKIGDATIALSNLTEISSELMNPVKRKNGF